MLKRQKLERMLRRISDDEFDAIWKNTYGYLPEGRRLDLARDYVAEQYDEELDRSIAVAKSILTHAPQATPKAKPNQWLPPR